MDLLRAAVIGRTGRGDYGHGLDLVWQDLPGVQLVAVADDDKVGLAATAKKLKVDKAFADYRQMFDQVKPQVVSIGPRWVDQHRDMVVAAAERGIHVYLEKPLCRTLAEADEMVAACERTHTKLAVAHPTRHSPRIPVIKELIAKGKIGRILELRGRGKEDQRGGSEDLWVLGTHIMDLIRLFGGEPTWCFGGVNKAGRPIAKSDLAEGAEGLGPLAGDAVSAMYGMGGSATAYFASHRNASGNRPRFALQIFGSDGILELTTGYLPSVKYLADPSWSPGQSGARWENVTSAGLGKPEPLAGKDEAANRQAVLELLAAIRENRQPVGSIYDGRAAVEMIVAVFESQRLGKPAEFPLANRQNPLTML
ncbi:MAG TPA: Gfo/Idh/MocA family oxidoreductase [Pirellulales bacterium]|jgi:predicted dehydrogenase|nr:Gfo/Idh/MocA family oxidoreductase [Pirellulales bacterium]